MAIGESSEAAHAKEMKEFPVGMRVVAIDDDPICLGLLNKLLTKCQYKVTCFTDAVEALKMIKENKDDIDLVITDVHMPKIDGFQLLEIAGLQLDLPVIMLSANDTKETIMKGIMHGASDYLIKPARLEELRVIWKQVARRQPLKEFDENAAGNNHTSGGGDDAERRPRETHGGIVLATAPEAGLEFDEDAAGNNHTSVGGDDAERRPRETHGGHSVEFFSFIR